VREALDLIDPSDFSEEEVKELKDLCGEIDAALDM
jgi:hypothetical protein